ncbi:hypothetical protein [Flavobacterium koreense]|jgi:hypothetical protein
MVESSKDKTYGRIIVFIIVSSLIYFSVNHTINKDKEKQSMIANQKIDSLNRAMPFILKENFLRADSVVIVNENNRSLRYVFTILNVDENTTQIYLDALKYDFQKNSQNYYDKDKSMILFRKNKFTIQYYYKDKNQNFLFDFIIKPLKD